VLQANLQNWLPAPVEAGKPIMSIFRKAIPPSIRRLAPANEGAAALMFGLAFIPVVLTAGAAWWMRATATGRSIYAIGGNVEAARLVGISPERTTLMVFALHGVFVGIASVLFATQLQVIQSTVPNNLELTIITAAVVGGVSILGGRGLVVGATLAAILFATINSSLIFLDVSAYWLRAVQGLLILATVLADIARRRASA
jgi:ribose/xylose/arabinose/galactoside ABC-type transport system permease subunit